MSATAGIARAERARRPPRTLLEQYRDDGPLSRGLGAAFGRFAKLPPVALLFVAVVPLLALAAAEGDGASDGTAAAAVGWLIVIAGISSGRPHTDRFAWAVPALMRLGEYSALIWIATLAGDSSVPAAFALIAALAFRHYDLVYRPRTQGVSPPPWLEVVAGGWDGRLLLACGLLFAGALPAGFFVLAALLGVLFVAECVRSWVRFQTLPVSLYEDEEGEGE